jgi:5-amino-6-(5-phosphoribosylamino)uracil reductase
MKHLPHIIISTAMSLDGYIDDAAGKRLRISNDKDFDRVDALRASVDGILIGANTIRKDNPRLLLKSEDRKKTRIKKGLSASPVKITLSLSGNIDSSASFFAKDGIEKIIYTTDLHRDTLRNQFPSEVHIVSGGKEIIDLQVILQDLYKRSIKRLMVEGGSSILTQFFQEGLVDELHLAIAGFFVGQKDAPRFVKPGNFPQNADHRMHLDSVSALDDITVLVYTV